MTNYARYCPSPEGVALEHLVRYIQLRVADSLRTRVTSVNFELVLGAVSEALTRGRSPTAPIFGDIDAVLARMNDKLSLETALNKLYALLRELLTIRSPIDYLAPIKSFSGPFPPAGPLYPQLRPHA